MMFGWKVCLPLSLTFMILAIVSFTFFW
jgi:NADH:ubiquinone oxidoreductase subunit H